MCARAPPQTARQIEQRVRLPRTRRDGTKTGRCSVSAQPDAVLRMRGQVPAREAFGGEAQGDN